MSPSELTKHFKICALESERLYDVDFMEHVGRTEIPFGKYKGQNLCEVPLRYLDETVCVMPATWFVRTVTAFVDHAMGHHPMLTAACLSRAPTTTLEQLDADWIEEDIQIACALSESRQVD